MTRDDLKKIETALWMLPAQQNLTREEMRVAYFNVLKDVPSELTEPLLAWIVLECRQWRPSIGAMHAYLQRLTGTAPIEGHQVISEIRSHIAANGTNCVPVPGRPACFLPGPPPNLTPQARAFVEAHGGWEAICLADIGSEEIYWHEAAKEAAEVCERLKIEAARHAIASHRSNASHISHSTQAISC